MGGFGTMATAEARAAEEGEDAAITEGAGAPLRHSSADAGEVRSGGGMRLRSEGGGAGAASAVDDEDEEDAAAAAGAGVGTAVAIGSCGSVALTADGDAMGASAVNSAEAAAAVLLFLCADALCTRTMRGSLMMEVGFCGSAKPSKHVR